MTGVIVGQLDALALLDEVLFEPYRLTVTWLSDGAARFLGCCEACNWAAGVEPMTAADVHAAMVHHYREMATLPWHRPWPDRWTP